MADVKKVDLTNLSCNESRLPVHPISWSYSSDIDALADIKAADYFAGSLIRQGDTILVKATDGSALLLLDVVTADDMDVVLTNTVKTATFA